MVEDLLDLRWVGPDRVMHWFVRMTHIRIVNPHALDIATVVVHSSIDGVVRAVEDVRFCDLRAAFATHLTRVELPVEGLPYAALAVSVPVAQPDRDVSYMAAHGLAGRLVHGTGYPELVLGSDDGVRRGLAAFRVEEHSARVDALHDRPFGRRVVGVGFGVAVRGRHRSIVTADGGEGEAGEGD